MKLNSEISVCNVESGPFSKTVEVPYSKSAANRILILAAIAEGPVTIKGIPLSSDVLNLIIALKKIGLTFEETQNEIKITNSFPACEKKEGILYLETGDGGTTNRFLLPLLARGQRIYRLKAEGRMKERPMDEILNVLKNEKVHVKQGLVSDDFWIEIQGPFNKKEGTISVDCSRSTQFASGLTLAFADRPFLKVVMDKVESSEKYLEMTLHLIDLFRQGIKEYVVPPDFSGLSYPLALGASLGEVLVSNCHSIDHFQADSILIKILKEMGAQVNWSPQGLLVKNKGDLKSIQLDCSGFPDLVPTLVYLCSYAKGESTLSCLEVLRHKESDRIEEVIKLLKAFQIPYRLEKKDRETLVIEGILKAQTPWIELHPAPDHRMVMVSALYCRKNNGGSIDHADHVKKSYPHFFSLF